jgi:hypothetical protein
MPGSRQSRERGIRSCSERSDNTLRAGHLAGPRLAAFGTSQNLVLNEVAQLGVEQPVRTLPPRHYTR